MHCIHNQDGLGKNGHVYDKVSAHTRATPDPRRGTICHHTCFAPLSLLVGLSAYRPVHLCPALYTFSPLAFFTTSRTPMTLFFSLHPPSQLIVFSSHRPVFSPFLPPYAVYEWERDRCTVHAKTESDLRRIRKHRGRCWPPMAGCLFSRRRCCYHWSLFLTLSLSVSSSFRHWHTHIWRHAKMGWWGFVDSLNCHVSFEKVSFLWRALLQKRPDLVGSLQNVATPSLACPKT